MSFILDALKKSETDRQRHTGPALFEVKVAPPKARFPVWAVAIVALLVINMVIVGWLLLRRSSRSDDTNAQSAPPVAASPAAPAAPTPANITAYNSGPPNNGTSQQVFAPPPPPTQPVSAPQGAAVSAPPGGMSPAGTSPAGLSPGGISTGNMAPADESSRPPPGHLPVRDLKEPTLAGAPPDSGADPGTGNPDDYAPATDPANSTSIFKGHVRRGTESGLMLYQDLAVTNGSNLPPIRLDLHVYAANPPDRFALINMHKLHEGDSIEGGVRVEAITPDGVIMSHNGTKFLLPRE
jgi:general secretion pathway protein B